MSLMFFDPLLEQGLFALTDKIPEANPVANSTVNVVPVVVIGAVPVREVTPEGKTHV